MFGKFYMFKQPYFAIAPIIRPPSCNTSQGISILKAISTKTFVSGCCDLLSHETPISSLPLWIQARYKHSLDTSLVPTIIEDDLEEQFITGSGPGGSNVNKNRNCVLLKHKPTGLVVKCHLSRLLQDNRKLAREMLINKLDEHINGDMSLTAQKERMLQKKSTEGLRKTKRLNDLKKKYQEFVANRSKDPPDMSKE